MHINIFLGINKNFIIIHFCYPIYFNMKAYIAFGELTFRTTSSGSQRDVAVTPRWAVLSVRSITAVDFQPG